MLYAPCFCFILFIIYLFVICLLFIIYYMKPLYFSVILNVLYFAICGLVFSYIFVNFNLLVYYTLSIFAVVYYVYEKRKKR